MSVLWIIAGVYFALAVGTVAWLLRAARSGPVHNHAEGCRVGPCPACEVPS